MNDLFCLARSFLETSIELIVFGKKIMLYVIHRYCLLTNMLSYGMRIKAQRCLFGFASLREIVILVVSYDVQGNILSSAKFYKLEEEKYIRL